MTTEIDTTERLKRIGDLAVAGIREEEPADKRGMLLEIFREARHLPEDDTFWPIKYRAPLGYLTGEYDDYFIKILAACIDAGLKVQWPDAEVGI